MVRIYPRWSVKFCISYYLNIHYSNTKGVVTYTAQYTITNDASYSGSIVNRAVASANVEGTNNQVSDQSDDPATAAANDDTKVSIDPVPGLEVTKIATVTDEGDGFVGGGDVINYTITVKNIGNVTLTGVTVSDTLTDGNTSTLNMSSGPSFSGSDKGSNTGTLLAGETATYIAYYIISDAAAATQKIRIQQLLLPLVLVRVIM